MSRPVAPVAVRLLGGRTESPGPRAPKTLGDRGGHGPKEQPEKQWEAIGREFIRSLSNVERAYYSLHGKYESTMELYETGAMNGAMRGLTRKFGIGTLRDWGWDFFVDVSPNGKQYQASVHATRAPVTPGGQTELRCLLVFFGDQTGATYEGRSLSCK